MALSATVAVNVAAVLAGAPDVGAAKHNISELFTNSFADGTGANQATNLFADDFTIPGTGTQTYDLAGGVTNGLGAVLTFTAIKALVIANTGTAPLSYGGGATPFTGFLGDASDKITIPAGGILVLTDPGAAGRPVTANTGDLITIGATGGAGTIIIIGEA